MPVRWLGTQTVDTRFADPIRALPICIGAGALGPDLPERDLFLSPSHGVLIDGLLVQAGALVNGTSIRRVARAPVHIVYHHVELDAHALLLAEGVAAESYLELVQDLPFDNAADRPVLAGQPEELPYPRVRSHRQGPPALRDRLAARAAALLPSAEVA